MAEEMRGRAIEASDSASGKDIISHVGQKTGDDCFPFFIHLYITSLT